MLVVIPLGGNGVRFRTSHPQTPKALVQVGGFSMIEWVIGSLKIPDGSPLLIPYHEALSGFDFENLLLAKFPYIDIRFMELEHDTRGAADTVKIALEQMASSEELGNPVLSIDGDTHYSVDIIRQYQDSGCDNRVFCFKDKGTNPIFSYTRCVHEDLVTEIAEKDKISDWACSGAYGFRSASTYLKACSKMLHCGARQKGEYYISGTIKVLLEDPEMEVRRLPLNADRVHCLGTPSQLAQFRMTLGQ